MNDSLRCTRCCFTGHRPSRLLRPEDDIRVDLENSILASVRECCHSFISGMACGVDIWAAEIVVRMKDQFPDLNLHLIAAIPFDLSEQSRINLPPRIRMSTLYAVSQSHNGRVANTCNLSEDWVGYSTRYGDSAGDFSPCSHLTVQEVKAVGRLLGLPAELVDKVPSDGLCGKTDEDNLGFTYAELDRYIREGIIEDADKKENIDRLHRSNLFKLRLMPSFEPEIAEYGE